MIPYSVLDLSPIPEGATAGNALHNTVDLAQQTEHWGYTRYWLAEHHNSTGIASAATAVVIGHVAGNTQSIRVGAGGIMLPNHAPMMVAEAFGTLATLYPGRIDLGLGRAPGTDPVTAQALRRGTDRSEHFQQDVVETIGLLGDVQDGQHVVATPGAGTKVPVWMLGSSLAGAQLAARLGLPYAFASHFAPDALKQALQTYRHQFTPGITPAPRVILLVNMFAADTDEDAVRMRSSMILGFIRLRTGNTGPLPAPVERLEDHASAPEIAMADHQLRIAAVGTPDRVHARLNKLIDLFAPDEMMFCAHVHDHQARLRSFEIAAEVMSDINHSRAA